MRILIQDKFTDAEKNYLIKELSQHHLVFSNKLTQDQIDCSDVILGNPSEKLEINSSHIKLIQLNSAGSDTFIHRVSSDTVLCNASGCYGIPLSEHVMALLLAVLRNFPSYFDLQQQAEWKNLRIGKEIYDSNICIVGCGDIGQECAKRLSAFGAHIIGVKKRYVDSLPYFDEVYTFDKLDEILANMDIVILCVPQTKETIGLFDKQRLLKMKKDAVLINVGRGSAIVEKDLLEILPTHLYGVGLDVVVNEPMSEENPLWKQKKVIITPHCAGGFVWKSTRENYLHLCVENVQRIEHHISCINQVDLLNGYRKNTQEKI